jgi:hypothetical protein
MMVLTVMFFVFSCCVLSLSSGGPGGGERAEHLDSVLPGEPL